ncbi:MAG: hypothetical protein LUG95_08590 [Clostridiales bacterium]|nr:hypothetical protein [Clostridiales bacterium]
MERLDKIISASLNVTRSEAVHIIKKGEITVDSKTVKILLKKLMKIPAPLLISEKSLNTAGMSIL